MGVTQQTGDARHPRVGNRTFGYCCAVVALVLAGCGGGGSNVTAESIQTNLRPELQSKLRDRLEDESITVDSLTCAKKSSSEATCAAGLSDSTGASSDIKVNVDIDPDTGNIVWQVAQ